MTGNGMNTGYSYFYTGNGLSSAGPVLIGANPPSGSTNVPLNTIGGPWNNTSLMLLFSEPFATESLANITFTPAGGSAEPVAVYPQNGNFIADVQLPWGLQPNTTYTFNVSGVTDLNGNPASGTTTSSFTTGVGFDWTNPTNATATPANNSTVPGVNPVISLTFREAMNPILITSSQIYLRTHNTQTTVPTTLALSSVGGATVVTLTPTSPLAESTIYDLMYWPNNWYLYDIAGNPNYNYGVQTTFTTGTVAAINGVCGSATGKTFSAPPTANLCSAGTASGQIFAGGSFTWICGGQYGGTDASCSATVTPASACYPQSSLPASSLVSWWKGEGDATDHMGNNNGTLENCTSFGLGEVNDAFSFNGNNQYVLIGQPVPADLQIQNAITMSAWVFPSAYPTNYGSGAYGLIVGSQHDGSPVGCATLFYAADGQTGAPPGHIDFQLGDGSNWHDTFTETQVPLNQWTLITATRTANTAMAQIYFNGVAQPVSGTDTAWNGTVNYSASWFAIGQEVNENRPFTGLIDEVQVYNAVLNAAQVQGIYNAGSAGVCP